jgi:hypothetical protein
MADDKRTEVICTKLSERMALNPLHEAATEDRSISEFLYLLICKELYGRTVRQDVATRQST